MFVEHLGITLKAYVHNIEQRQLSIPISQAGWWRNLAEKPNCPPRAFVSLLAHKGVMCEAIRGVPSEFCFRSAKCWTRKSFKTILGGAQIKMLLPGVTGGLAICPCGEIKTLGGPFQQGQRPGTRTSPLLLGNFSLENFPPPFS